MTTQNKLNWQPMALLVVVSMVWGANMGMVKFAVKDVSPLFQATIRSFVAALCLMAWMLIRGKVLFPSLRLSLHGIVAALLFGGEFTLIYYALGFHYASRIYVLVYTAPFFVALGAHFFLKDDRLNRWKVMGLILAFAGVVVLFSRQLGEAGGGSWFGDFLALVAGAFWGATTLYIKRFMVEDSSPHHTLLYQTLFSVPLLLGLSLWLEPVQVSAFSWSTAGNLFYQSVIVVFISYLAWFVMVHRYQVSLLHAFSFLTPVFGVLISGVLMMGEPLTLRLLIALGLVSMGLVVVNWSPKAN
ncbi:MAG: DMT family transporter [Desulfarculaceae bacterium]